MGAAYGRGGRQQFGGGKGCPSSPTQWQLSSCQSPGPPRDSPGLWSKPSAILGCVRAHVFSGMPNFSLEKRCQSTAPSAMRPALAVPLHARPCPPMPMPCSKVSLKQGISPVMIRSEAASFVPGSACYPDAVGVSIPSRSSPKAEMQPGSQETPALAA